MYLFQSFRLILWKDISNFTKIQFLTKNIDLCVISFLSCNKSFSIDILYVANKWFSILKKRYIDVSILFFLYSNCKSYTWKDKKETRLHQIQPKHLFHLQNESALKVFSCVICTKLNSQILFYYFRSIMNSDI